MKFTYESYSLLVSHLRKSGYSFCDYHNHGDVTHPCIMRHDIDISLDKALEFARFEHSLGIKSTYFALLTSNFYNTASKHNVESFFLIKRYGHEIGLHFDEAVYDNLDEENMVDAILRERDLLQEIVKNGEVTVVSMHRPSRWVLDADLKIPGMVNSYGKEFFQDFKYVSDSRMCWREDVMKYATEKTYPKLHILTHPFWYSDTERSMHGVLDSFLAAARSDRYAILNENFTDLSSVIKA